MEKRESWRSKFYKFAFNLWPCIRRSGVRIHFVSSDFHQIQVRVPLSWKTKNRVGTLFGGSLYSATDPFYMIMLMEILGKGYIVWDKAAEIRFRRPGVETVYGNFMITPDQVEVIRKQVEASGETTFVWKVDLRDKEGKVITEVEKTLYVASKSYYAQKRKRRAEGIAQSDNTSSN